MNVLTVHELNRSLSKSSRTLLASSPVQHRYNPLRPLCLLINALAIVVFPVPGPPSINILGFFLKPSRILRLSICNQSKTSRSEVSEYL